MTLNPTTPFDARPARRTQPPTDRVTAARERHEAAADARTTAVIAAITQMYEQLGEPQELRDFARTALMSPFHFHRVFRTVTAATPGRFLTALRMAQARRLLLETTMSATDISIAVGYSSFGTFTTQFTKLVGLSPGRFRVRATAVADLPVRDLLEGQRTRPKCGRGPVGWIGPRPDKVPGLAVAGLFPSGIAQDQPVACAVIEPPGSVRLPEVDAQGEFEALAVSVAGDATVGQVLTGNPDAGVLVGAAERPVVLGCSTQPRPFWITLRQPLVTDPPLLLAFPLLADAQGDGHRNVALP
jgi:AraC family transcriptional regulator